MQKIDVWGHQKKYEEWKESARKNGIDDLTKKNSDILIQHIFDMEMGVNISNQNKKGPRSYPRLNNIRQRLAQMMIMLQERGIKDITALKEEDLAKLFQDMRSGKLQTKLGGAYRSTGDYAKIFSAFWHWHMKVQKKKGIQVMDITEDIDKAQSKSRFVYITKDQLDSMLEYFSEDEQVLLLFVFDSIIRSPTELMSLKVKNVYRQDGVVWVHLPAEITKTNFDREFNLLYCGDALLKYIERKKLKPENSLFEFSYVGLTNKMQSVAKKVLGEKISHPIAEGKYRELSLYDLRHSGAIHLRVLAKKTKKISLDAIRQRGGWKDFKMLNYYTRFIGLDGSIDKEDLLIDEDKSKIQKRIDALEKRLLELSQGMAKEGYTPDIVEEAMIRKKK